MFESLSEEQLLVVKQATGKHVVRACPGSGKTYCVANRLVLLTSEWKDKLSGVATLSFTNIACQEIDNQISNYVNLRSPHFLGTVDSFLNKFVFLPHGHLMLGCKKRPTLVGEPYGKWNYQRFANDYYIYFDACSFDIDGNLFPTVPYQNFHFRWFNKNGGLSKHVENLKEAKLKCFAMGYATQSDANYFSLKILETYPIIAKSIVKRFPYFIIDEAQDTTAIQMRIIEVLVESGLENIMLVGDPDQAIFEWNNAKPSLFVDKFKSEDYRSLVLNENRRSSQAICNITQKISSLDCPSNAVNETIKDIDIGVEIVEYRDENIKDVVKAFLDKCRTHGIVVSKNNVAVLYRSKELHYRLLDFQGSYVWVWEKNHNLGFELSFAKLIFCKGDFKEALKRISKVYVRLKLNKKACTNDQIEKYIDQIGVMKFREALFSFLKSIPDLVETVEVWASKMNILISKMGVDDRVKFQSAFGQYTFAAVYPESQLQNELNYTLGTVHSVKGETYDAVLLLLKKKAGRGAYYKTMLNKKITCVDDEEMRIVYVAITRPRSFLSLAVPDSENKSKWENALTK